MCFELSGMLWVWVAMYNVYVIAIEASSGATFISLLSTPLQFAPYE